MIECRLLRLDTSLNLEVLSIYIHILNGKTQLLLENKTHLSSSPPGYSYQKLPARANQNTVLTILKISKDISLTSAPFPTLIH